MHLNNLFYVEECYGIVTNKRRIKCGITYAKEKTLSVKDRTDHCLHFKTG